MTINHDEAVALIEAHRAGKKIEECWGRCEWQEFTGAFYFGEKFKVQYRVVEEPKKVKLLAFLTDFGYLQFVKEGSTAHHHMIENNHPRLPNLDMIGELE